MKVLEWMDALAVLTGSISKKICKTVNVSFS